MSPEIHVPAGAKKRKRFRGRGQGNGRGTYAGRGDKGQNKRSGGKVRPGFEGGQMPLYRRVVKKGFSNYPFKKEYVGLNLRELENKVQDGETVTLESLRQKGLVKKSAQYVKLLGEGELTKKITVQGLKVSKSAAEKIQSAGGTVVAEEAATSEKAQGSETGDQSKTEGTESDESES